MKPTETLRVWYSYTAVTVGSIYETASQVQRFFALKKDQEAESCPHERQRA
jgi:hypothetical protein